MRFRDFPIRFLGGVRRKLSPPKPVVIGLASLALLAPGLWYRPVTETLSGPRRAVLRSTVPGLELGVCVDWYDLRLNRRGERRKIAFGPDGIVALPEYRIVTNAGRLWLKRRLMPRGRWTACENCYGPNTRTFLYSINNYTPPEKMRLTQNSETLGDTVFYEAALLIDETQFDERPLQIDDLASLMTEVRGVLKTGKEVNVAPDLFGPALRHLNPVRAERDARGSLIVWTGGKVGYSLTPDSDGGPFLNGAMISGTDYAGVQKIERLW